MEFWFVTTDHLTKKIWFRDEEDFKMGMNLVAVLAVALDVDVLSFILMSNHVHFVLCCSKTKTHQFIKEFKKRHSQYMNKKYGVKELLRRVHVQVDPVSGADESLEWVIAYTNMNSVAAGICLAPTGYPWGTGDTFFKAKPAKGRRIGTYSDRARVALLHSTQPMPPHLLVGDDGYILPDSYVDVEKVQNLYHTPKRMNYFLVNSSKAKRRLDAKDNAPNFRDQVILPAIGDLCQSLFQKSSLEALTQDELAELLKQLRYRFSSHANQLARVTGIPYQKVVDLLDKV
jgi:REP element-mobilizing transposase RayT